MDEIKLLNYLKGEVSNEEAKQITDWCEASPENRKMLEQLYYVSFVGERVAAMDAIDVDRSFVKLENEIKRKEGNFIRRSRDLKWKRYAVLIAAFMTGIIFSVGISYFALNDPSSYMVATTVGQRAQFILPDGSKVWLNASSQLSYTTSLWSRERLVKLSGEAYFEVARNERLPFIVDSKNIKTCVLGTKFNIRARIAEEKVVTTLLNGSVLVNLPGKEDGFVLKPGQILNVDTKTLKSELTESDSAREVLLWLNGKLDFEQVTFIEMTRCLEKHFDVHFIFEDEQLKKERFTCRFLTDDNITEMLSALSLTKHFQYRIEGRQIYLSVRK